MGLPIRQLGRRNKMTKLSLLFGLLMTMNNFNTSVAVQPPATPAAIVMNHDESRFVDLLNKERAQRGMSQLSIDPLLIKVARDHSREMAEKKYFSHHSPTVGLNTPMDRYLSSVTWRPSYLLVGENLFYCSIVDVDRGHQAFMNSPGHRANILESRYERVGVGIYETPGHEFYVTEMFITKQD
jgi:uncharacterized protein YkwD